MKKKELRDFLISGRKEIEQTMEEFERHSKNFDKRVKKILTML